MLRQIVTDGDGNLAMKGDCGPRLHGAVSFYYYENLAATVRWYERHLGLAKRFETDWVVIFELAAGSYVGLVDAREGVLQPLPSQGKSSIIALETPDLEDWYNRLHGQDDVPILQPLTIGSKGLTEQFMVVDPGGYVIEFFRWRGVPSGWMAGSDA